MQKHKKNKQFYVRITLGNRANHKDILVSDFKKSYALLCFLIKSVNKALVKNLSIIDDQNTVYCIYIPETKQLFRIGDIVMLRPEFATAGEEKYVFVIRNLNELSERGNIMCLNSTLTLCPCELVGLEMVEPTGDNVEPLFSQNMSVVHLKKDIPKSKRSHQPENVTFL